MENQTRPTQSAFAGVLFIGGFLAAAIALIGLFEFLSGIPYVRWVTAWERIPSSNRLVILCSVIIGLIFLLVVGCGIYLYIVELRYPGQTVW